MRRGFLLRAVTFATWAQLQRTCDAISTKRSFDHANLLSSPPSVSTTYIIGDGLDTWSAWSDWLVQHSALNTSSTAIEVPRSSKLEGLLRVLETGSDLVTAGTSGTASQGCSAPDYMRLRAGLSFIKNEAAIADTVFSLPIITADNNTGCAQVFQWNSTRGSERSIAIPWMVWWTWIILGVSVSAVIEEMRQQPARTSSQATQLDQQVKETLSFAGISSKLSAWSDYLFEQANVGPLSLLEFLPPISLPESLPGPPYKTIEASAIPESSVFSGLEVNLVLSDPFPEGQARTSLVCPWLMPGNVVWQARSPGSIHNRVEMVAAWPFRDDQGNLTCTIGHIYGLELAAVRNAFGLDPGIRPVVMLSSVWDWLASFGDTYLTAMMEKTAMPNVAQSMP